jgi:hypothetical protein
MAINWASGQDDVPAAPEGIIVMSEGKAAKAYIEAKEADIEKAVVLTNSLLESLNIDDNITPIQLEIIKSTVRDIRVLLVRALL